MERSGGDSNFWPLIRGKHPSARWHFKIIIIFFFCRRFRWWCDGDLPRLKQESRQFLPSRIPSISLLLSPKNPNKHPNMFVVSLLPIPWRSKTRLQFFHLFFELKPGLSVQQLSYVFIAEILHYLHHFSSINLHTATVPQIAETASKRVYECWTSGSSESLSFFTYIMFFWNLNWRI